MHPAITHRHSHACILDSSSADVDYGFLYDIAPDENWADEGFALAGPWVVLLDEGTSVYLLAAFPS